MHHGILGMKWGVRRTPEQLGHKKVAPKNTKAQVKSSQSEPKKRTLSDLSDDELRRRVSRLQMEKQYKDLTRQEISAGRKWVNSVLNDTSKKLATKFLVKAIENIIDPKSSEKKNSKDKK